MFLNEQKIPGNLPKKMNSGIHWGVLLGNRENLFNLVHKKQQRLYFLFSFPLAKFI